MNHRNQNNKQQSDQVDSLSLKQIQKTIDAFKNGTLFDYDELAKHSSGYTIFDGNINTLDSIVNNMSRIDITELSSDEAKEIINRVDNVMNLLKNIKNNVKEKI